MGASGSMAKVLTARVSQVFVWYLCKPQAHWNGKPTDGKKASTRPKVPSRRKTGKQRDEILPLPQQAEPSADDEPAAEQVNETPSSDSSSSSSSTSSSTNGSDNIQPVLRKPASKVSANKPAEKKPQKPQHAQTQDPPQEPHEELEAQHSEHEQEQQETLKRSENEQDEPSQVREPVVGLSDTWIACAQALQFFVDLFCSLCVSLHKTRNPSLEA